MTRCQQQQNVRIMNFASTQKFNQRSTNAPKVQNFIHASATNQQFPTFTTIKTPNGNAGPPREMIKSNQSSPRCQEKVANPPSDAHDNPARHTGARPGQRRSKQPRPETRLHIVNRITRDRVSAGGPTRATPGDKHQDVIQRSKPVRAGDRASPAAPALAGRSHYVPRACSPGCRPPVWAPRHPQGTAPVWAASGTPSSVGV